MAKELAKKEDNAVASGGFDYGENAGEGFEDVKSTDLSIPFLNILQSNSPEVDGDSPVEGAKPGLIYNTVTGELMDELIFIPCHKQEAWVEWVPRPKGGGFVGMHDPESDLVKDIIAQNGSRIPEKDSEGKRIPFKVNDGNELIETYYLYGLVYDQDSGKTVGFGVMSFTSTKIKAYRNFLTSMYMLKGKPPIFANRAKIKTLKQKNEAGTYYIYDIMPMNHTWASSLIDPNEERHLLEEARSFKEMILNGAAKADFEQQDAKATASPDESGEKAPF